MISGLVLYSSTLVIFTFFILYYTYILYYISTLYYNYILYYISELYYIYILYLYTLPYLSEFIIIDFVIISAVGSSVGRAVE